MRAARNPADRGVLALVATPIGNLGDLSARAVSTLASATLIACEDTRRTGRLLAHAGIVDRPPLLTVNDHTEAAAVERVLAELGGGGLVAVVTDAGTPGISDPGERLVRAAVGAGFEVRVIPGPSAAVAALVASGLPTGRFVFEGFLPRKGPARRARLAAVAAEERTVVLYEAPHRVVTTLAELAEVCGADRPVTVARELTKLHEEIWRGPLGEAAAAVGRPRGEYVIVVGGAPPVAGPDDATLRSEVAAERARGASARDAVAAVARRHGVSRWWVCDVAGGDG